MKKDIKHMELRYCDIPKNEHISVCIGDRWKREYESLDGPMHFHNVMEIGVCYFGDGQLRLDKESIPYHGNMISIIPPNHPHQTISQSGEQSFWEFMFFDCDKLLKDMYPDDVLLQQRMMERINENAYFINETEIPELSHTIYNILDEMRLKKEYYKECVRGLCQSLLIRLYRMCTMEESATESLYMRSGFEQMHPALEFIREHYPESIKVRNLASVCHVSESHFRRLFELNVGMAPMEYLNKVRIGKACELIRSTGLTMEEVAIRVGYTTISTFNRNFKSILNQSPYQWKKRQNDYTDGLDVVETENIE